MSYLLFWARAAGRRFASLFRASPVIVVGAIVIAAAFIAARNDIALTLNTQELLYALLFFTFVSLLLSFKRYPARSLLIMYSKSRFRNKAIYILFFIRQAFLNNILLLIFNVVALKGVVKVESVAVMPAATVCSIVLSLLVMYLKNEYVNRRVGRVSVSRSKSHPVVKSAVYDYFTSDFMQTALVSFALFILVAVEVIRNSHSFPVLERPSVILIGMVVILSLGFIGLIDSVSHINWRYLSVVCPKHYSYHFNRSALFLAAFFGVLIAAFVITAALSGAVLLFKHLYCLLALLALSIHISFTNNGAFYKAVVFMLAAALTVWISTLRIAFLPALAAPVLVMFLKARNEYREWYYL